MKTGEIKLGAVYRTAYFEEQYIKITQIQCNPESKDDEAQAKGYVYPTVWCRIEDRSFSTNVSQGYLIREISLELTPEEFL